MISRAPCMRSTVVIRLRCGDDTGEVDGSYLGPGVCAMFPSIFRATLSASGSLHDLNNILYYENDSHYRQRPWLCKPTYKGTFERRRAPFHNLHSKHGLEGKVSTRAMQMLQDTKERVF